MKRTLLTFFAAVMLMPLGTFASGSYCACMPKPPAKQAKIDRDKYDLGQKVFNGKTAMAEVHTETATAQRPRLEALQAQLPDKVRAKQDLPAMAGKISNEQLDALEYYVKQRYPQK